MREAPGTLRSGTLPLYAVIAKIVTQVLTPEEQKQVRPCLLLAC